MRIIKKSTQFNWEHQLVYSILQIVKYKNYSHPIDAIDLIG